MTVIGPISGNVRKTTPSNDNDFSDLITIIIDNKIKANILLNQLINKSAANQMKCMLRKLFNWQSYRKKNKKNKTSQ